MAKKAATAPKAPKAPRVTKAMKAKIVSEVVGRKEDLIRRLARQGGLDHRTPEDLKETFRTFIGEARALTVE